MKLGKKQAVYGVVLGVAAAAFVVDRLFFSPETAEARPQPRAVANPTPGEAVSTPSPSSPVTPQPIPAGWLAERLKSASPDSGHSLRDVFAVPACWRPATKPVATTASAPAKAKLLGDSFRSNHHLVAVLIESGNSRAVVDGQLVPVGGSIDGFRLVALTHESARFVHGQEQVTLTLADSGPITPH